MDEEIRFRAAWSIALPVLGWLLTGLAIATIAGSTTARLSGKDLAVLVASLAGAFICAVFGTAGIRLALATRRMLARLERRPRGSWISSVGFIASALVLLEGTLLLVAGVAVLATI